MAGIYIHIPFCRQACHYCNFHFTTSLRNKNALVAALLSEAKLRKEYLQGESVETIYFGGGTPSLLDIAELESLLKTFRTLFHIAENAEITLETNPDDISIEKLNQWKQAGINRLSIGVQSFFEEDLQWMNRAHNARQAIESLEWARSLFNNITIDLIYGTPLLTHEKWKHNVDTAISFDIPHLSCYALTVEPKTPLYKMIHEHKVQDVNPDKQSEQFSLLMQWLEEAGYEHYEISNFAKPGFRSRHNSSYWQRKKYLGLGPSAHSYDGISRQWNVSNNNIYIESISKEIIPAEKEVLTPVQQLNEYIMTSLRTIEGLNLDKVENDAERELKSIGKKYIDNDLMIEKGRHLILTKKGRLLADGIAADLFFS